ncbi:MAG: M64 family metallopeptidase [Woeseiaceae bacterium]
MLPRLFFFSLFFSSPGFAENPQTLRVDYYHSGNATMEMFSLDRVVLEPLNFSGNLSQPEDRTLRGKYSFEIVDPDSGAIAWSRSFSSIFGEWETTAEARGMNRTFHESLRLPRQVQAFDLILKKRGSDNRFSEVWRIRVDPNDYLVHREKAAYAEHVVAIEHNGDSATKVDVLLLGDGYTIGERANFLKKARELTDLLFSTPPFQHRRSDFNVWALAPPAAESGVSRPSTSVYRDSPVGASYDAFRSERYVLTNDNREWRRIASSTPYDFVEILTNSDTYGGGGIYGLFSTAAANSEWAGYLFVHEFAHHFAGLADEYYTSSVAYESPAGIVEPYEPNVTALLDPDNLKWRHLVRDETPLPTPWPKTAYEEHSLAYQARRANMRKENVSENEMNRLFNENQAIVEDMFSVAPHADVVGAFEGAIYQSKGYYRSEQNCIMFTRTKDFCRVCAAAIEEVIDEYTASR